MTSPIVCVASVLAAGLLAAPAAWAEPPCTRCAEDYLNARWAACGACFDACRGGEADKRWLAAAICLREAGDPAGAVARCDRITTGSTEASKCRIKVVDPIARETGAVEVVCAASGARATLEVLGTEPPAASALRSGDCPALFDHLSPGGYRVIIDYAGHRTSPIGIEIAAGQTTRVQEEAGRLKVECRAPGGSVVARLPVSGRPTATTDGSAPTWSSACPMDERLPAGWYRVTIDGPAGPRHETTIELPADQVVQIVEPPLPPPPPPEGDPGPWIAVGAGGLLAVVGGASHITNVRMADDFVAEQQAGRIECDRAAASSDCRSQQRWLDGTYWTAIAGYAVGGLLLAWGTYALWTGDEALESAGGVLVSPHGISWGARW